MTKIRSIPLLESKFFYHVSELYLCKDTSRVVQIKLILLGRRWEKEQQKSNNFHSLYHFYFLRLRN